MEAFKQRLVDHLVEEVEVVGAVVECPAHAVLDEVLGEVHIVVDVVEGYFRLNHPELGEVARRVGVFGAERGAESVDCAEGGGAEFAFELSAHGERGGLAEEVVGIVNLALLVLFEVVEVLGGHLEHLACAFAVAGGDDGRVEIVEAVLVEIAVDSHCHVVADAHHGTEGVGAQAHVGVLAHIFEGLSLLLHGVVCAAGAVNGDGRGLYLHALSRALALYERAFNAEACAGGDLLEGFFVELLHICHDLHVLDG